MEKKLEGKAYNLLNKIIYELKRGKGLVKNDNGERLLFFECKFNIEL